MDPERDLNPPAGAGPAGPELVDDWTRPVGRAAVRRGRGLPNVRVSTPVAFLAGIVVTALTAGVMLRPGAVADPSAAGATGAADTAAAPTSITAGGGQLAAGDGRGDDAGFRGGIVPNPMTIDRTPEPTIAPPPTPEATPDPTPEPTAKPTPKPTPVPVLTLSLGLKSNYPYLTWSACEGVSFDYYKVVRSSDSSVSWPPAGDDAMVAAVSAGGTLAAKDTGAPSGVRVYYRVFCVKSTGSGWSVIRSSAAKAIDVPVATEPPAQVPCTLSLSAPVVTSMVTQTGTVTGPAVTLTWTQCASPSLTYYKVARSSQPDPSYIRGTAGSVLIAAITPGNGVAFVDHPGSGTWYYRVEAVGNNPNGGHSLLGQTAVVTVTIP